jgi:6-pyruvoyltetrahydropterin/6-carboxytetrahydropterin synthase
MFELSKQFRFDAAHTLECETDAEANRRIHGHSYRAEVTVRGAANEKTGMLVDLGLFEQALAKARDALDHRMLNDVEGLGPPTLENLSAFIWRALAPQIPNLAKVAVYRDGNGDACVYRGPDQAAA